MECARGSVVGDGCEEGCTVGNDAPGSPDGLGRPGNDPVGTVPGGNVPGGSPPSPTPGPVGVGVGDGDDFDLVAFLTLTSSEADDDFLACGDVPVAVTVTRMFLVFFGTAIRACNSIR